MTRPTPSRSSLALALLLAGCTSEPPAAPTAPAVDATASPAAPVTGPGGATTVSIKPQPSLMLPAANLPMDRKADFHAGKALAHQPWVKAPTITDARDGLGPLYNARTCLMCHINGGRGPSLEADGKLPFTSLVRVSVPGADPVKGVVPEPTYGDQIQAQSVALGHQLRGSASKALKAELPAEADVQIRWKPHPFTYPDGQVVALRAPEVRLEALGYGPLQPGTMTSLRRPPPIHGMGLLELIPEAAIRAGADPDDADGDGISGRPNIAWDFEKKAPRLGRFGLKANKASLRLQVAGALSGDMGITSPVFPEQSCTAAQPKCQTATHGGDPQTGLEISESLLTLMVDFNMNLGVPARRKPDHPMVREGEGLFTQVGCAACHRPRFETGPSEAFPHLAHQQIAPYTDLLLHDLGPDLADGRPDYLASGSEWRTAPLWSVGLSRAVNGNQNFLHDGRARTIEEAILWHGGEAAPSRTRFAALPKAQRKALMAFVKSL